ncbi:MAG TPA: aldo/keto reductase [Bryobacteraceae bacterium]|jgi:aryl-alcohol dehydrogenase-like predicted oxidoreductase|nr:aldo/keto reductase [Bryobacteraceae bacterium]
MDRRQALNIMAGVGLAALARAQSSETTKSGDMIYRKLGSTGERVSAIGLGGAHLGRPSEQEAIQIVRSALDRGITFLDNCWDYSNGECEVRMGKALRDGYRNKAFLMTKFDGRTKQAAAAQIDQSLQRLQTDHIDLIQYHENIRLDDPDRFFAEGGALEGVLEAKKAGKIRYIGFTGHKDPLVHERMLDIANQHNFHFDSCQMPLNPMDAHFRSFANNVVPKLVAQGIGVLGMKSMASGIILKSNTVTPLECLHYALNLPTSVVITGCDSMKILDQAFEAARTFYPMAEAEIIAILEKTRTAAMHGQYEPFKISTVFDGTIKNPQWLTQV